MMTDKAKKILNKTAGITAVVAKAALHSAGESTVFGTHVPTGRVMKAIAGGRTAARTTIRPQFLTEKIGGVVDRTVGELNDLQWGYRQLRSSHAEANSSSRNTNYMQDYFAKQSARLRDVDPRNRVVNHARESGGLIGAGVGSTAAYLLTRKTKMKPLAGLLGVAPGFVAGGALASGAAKVYEQTKRAPKGSHNFHKKTEHEKIAIIRNENNGFHIYSHSGKHLGGPYSEDRAKKRLQQIEYFKKHGAFLDKFPRIRRTIATAMTAGSLATPAKAGVGDLVKALEKETPKLEAATSSRVFYHKPGSLESQKYIEDVGLKGPHWVTSDTARNTLPSGAEKRHIETFYFPQESGDVMRKVTKETVNPKYPNLTDRESWFQEFDYDEAKKYLATKKTLATK